MLYLPHRLYALMTIFNIKLKCVLSEFADPEGMVSPM